MKRRINVLSLDYAWDTIEYKIINLLSDYGALDTVDKDTFYLIGHFLLKYILKEITTCSINFESGTKGLETTLSTSKYPFNIFYIDYSNISDNKEILEYIDKKEFTKKLKSMVRDFNKITNHKIMEIKFPYQDIKNKSLSEISGSEEDLFLKKSILFQHKSKTKTPMKDILKLCKKYSIVLDELKIRKILFDPLDK